MNCIPTYSNAPNVGLTGKNLNVMPTGFRPVMLPCLSNTGPLFPMPANPLLQGMPYRLRRQVPSGLRPLVAPELAR